MVKRLVQWLFSGVAFGIGVVIVAYGVSVIWPDDRLFSSSELGEMLEVRTLNDSMVGGRLTFQIELANLSDRELDQIMLRVDLFDEFGTQVGSCSSFDRGVEPNSVGWLQVVCENLTQEFLPEWTEAKVRALSATEYAAP